MKKLKVLQRKLSKRKKKLRLRTRPRRKSVKVVKVVRLPKRNLEQNLALGLLPKVLPDETITVIDRRTVQDLRDLQIFTIVQLNLEDIMSNHIIPAGILVITAHLIIITRGHGIIPQTIPVQRIIPMIVPAHGITQKVILIPGNILRLNIETILLPLEKDRETIVPIIKENQIFPDRLPLEN